MLRHLCTSLLILTAPVAEAATVYVDASGVQVSGGLVFAGLCIGGLEDGACTFGQRQPSLAPSLRFAFPDVPPGTYAVAVFQDINGNGQLDRTPLGLPLEPYGFSNEAGRQRRPSFPAAAVNVGESDVRVGVRLAPIPQAR